MSLAETQKFLARLYTDADLRQRFLDAPEKTGLEFDLTKKEIAELARVAPAELEFFSESLFYKRLSQVEKFLPLTKKTLTNDFEKQFRRFADGFQPDSVKKLLHDAVEFAAFLRRQKLNPVWATDIAAFEQAKLEFYGLNKKFVRRTFRFDIRRLLSEISAENNTNFSVVPERKTFAVWIRVGKRTRHFVW